MFIFYCFMLFFGVKALKVGLISDPNAAEGNFNRGGSWRVIHGRRDVWSSDILFRRGGISLSVS